MTDDIPNAPDALMVQILREEVAALRAEAGRCDAVCAETPFGGPWRCRLARTHMGDHLAFGAGAGPMGDPPCRWHARWVR